MTKKEILKERYKRKNEGEDEVLCATIDTLSEVIVYDKDNTREIVQQRKKRTDAVSIFLDVENLNLTLSGKNYRETEIMIANKKDDVTIEVKKQLTPSNIQDTVHAEIARARNIKGQYWLVLLGEYNLPVLKYELANAVKQYVLKKKVKIFYDIDSYKAELVKIFA